MTNIVSVRRPGMGGRRIGYRPLLFRKTILGLPVAKFLPTGRCGSSDSMVSSCGTCPARTETVRTSGVRHPGHDPLWILDRLEQRKGTPQQGHWRSRPDGSGGAVLFLNGFITSDKAGGCRNALARDRGGIADAIQWQVADTSCPSSISPPVAAGQRIVIT
jgi:hypothetical protein